MTGLLREFRLGLMVAIALVLSRGADAQALQKPLLIQGEAGPVQIYDDSRALIIAESRYTAPGWDRLDQVPVEARRVETALQARGYNTTVASNLDQVGIEKTIKQFINRDVGVKTRLLIFYAGHGWSDDNGGFIVPLDAPGTAEEDFRSKIIGMSEILSWSYLSRARHITFVFDSCFSGAVFLTRSNLRPSTLFINDLDNSVRMVVTSGSATEQVPAGLEFGDLFIKGLNGAADLVQDGVITGSELGYWLKVNVAAKGNQTPQFGTSQEVKYKIGDVVLATVPASASGTAPARTMLRSRPAGESTRSAEVRSLGVPDRPSASVFTGIEVRYSRKLVDGTRLVNALDTAGVPYVQLRALETYPEPVNSIMCSPGVPLPAVKRLAATMIGSGVRLLAIFEHGYGPDKQLVIGTQPDLAQRLRSLTLRDLDSLSRCSLARRL